MKGCCASDVSLQNKFTLKGGEKFKIGRVVFTVKELVTPKTHYSEQDCVCVDDRTFESDEEGEGEEEEEVEPHAKGLIQLKERIR